MTGADQNPILEIKSVEKNQELTDDPLLTVDEVSQYLRVTPDTIRRLIRNKKIVAIKIGHEYRFRTSDVKSWITANKT